VEIASAQTRGADPDHNTVNRDHGIGDFFDDDLATELPVDGSAHRCIVAVDGSQAIGR
jgi:hypothetical protein